MKTQYIGIIATDQTIQRTVDSLLGNSFCGVSVAEFRKGLRERLNFDPTQNLGIEPCDSGYRVVAISGNKTRPIGDEKIWPTEAEAFDYANNLFQGNIFEVTANRRVRKYGP